MILTNEEREALLDEYLGLSNYSARDLIANTEGFVLEKLAKQEPFGALVVGAWSEEYQEVIYEYDHQKLGQIGTGRHDIYLAVPQHVQLTTIQYIQAYIEERDDWKGREFLLEDITKMLGD